jgi:hypothetical protein
MLSLALVVVIVSNVVLWSYQMNQFDWEKMQEKIEITSVESSSPWFTSNKEYVIENGSCTSGTYKDTWTVDSAYQTFKENAPLYYNSYNPSDYSLLGGTRLISGSLNNLRNNDEAYMTFRSYASNISKTDAFIAYRDSATSLNIPKERTWTGDTESWSPQNNMPNAGSPVRWVRVAYCPLEQRSYEKIVVTLSDDGYLDAYVWNGASWVLTSNIASSGVTANAYRCFDIAYEKTSGRALLVYSRGDIYYEIGYKIWNGSSWSNEYILDLPIDLVYWVSLATAPGTRLGTADDNEIAMICIDSYTRVYGSVWDGSAWNNMGITTPWDNAAAIATKECIAVAYEQLSGRAMFIWGDSVSTYNYYRLWNGSTLSSPTLLSIPAQGGVTNWVTLKPNPSSNELIYLVIDGGSNLNTAYWNGSAWTVHSEHDSLVDTNARRCADFAWEPSGSKGLLVWGTNTGQITWKNFTAPNTWSSNTSFAMGSSEHYWVQLRTNPRNVDGDVKILGAVLDSNYNLGAISWNGTTFTVIGEVTFTADTTTYSYECFELEFCYYGVSREFAVEVEFTGTSNTETWMQLAWTVDSSFTTGNVTVTLQLWDYQAGGYSTSGEGYITYTSGTTPNTDETRSQNITNPNRFIDASGNWKLKAKCVKSASEQFDWKVDLIELRFESQSDYALGIIGSFVLDTFAYPPEYIDSVEIQIGFMASDNLENWFLKAYNWANGQYNDIGTPITPETEEFKYYTVSLPAGIWQNYVNSGNSTVKVKFCDANLDADQTTINIDFFAVRIILNGTLFKFKNNSASTIHIIAIWIINATHHERYDADFFINPGENATQMRTDISLPSGDFTVKVVTEKGNIAVISNP